MERSRRISFFIFNEMFRPKGFASVTPLRYTQHDANGNIFILSCFMPHDESIIHGQNSKRVRLTKYLPEFVYGGIDGLVTTFAVVAGATGANLDLRVVLILGFANLFADGFSMSVGAFMSSKAEHDSYAKNLALEYREIDNLRDREVQEIRDIYAAK